MKLSHRSSLLALAAAIALAASVPAPAAAQTKIKFVLNWKYQGPQGWFFLADARGYFKSEGIDIVFDQGNGSGAAVPLVANGTYESGLGGINPLTEFPDHNPHDPPAPGAR